MIDAFVEYLQKERFDLLMGWNMINFDMPYLANRFPDFSERISPINETRYGADCPYPAGISIVDYYSWFKQLTFNKEKSYKLDDIAQKYLKDKPKGEFKFEELTEDIKDKNKLDVDQMVRLEEKFKIIPYFDEIRRLSKVEWEDLTWNSRIIDMLLLHEAKKQNVVLPMKPTEERGTLSEKEDFEGAYREALKTGVFNNVGKYDLTSAYPFAIMDFCLDSSNIKLEKEDNCIEINNTFFQQTGNAILPLVVKKLTTLKNEVKRKLSTIKVNDPDYKNIKQMYKAIKTVVNSAYGVMGNRFFRLYDKRVASATTFIVRSLLHYVRDELKNLGYEVIYIDTDSVFINSKENLTELLNQIIQKWGKEVFGKEKVSIEFDYEGHFESLFILTLCRYIGLLHKPDGETEEEIKGIEAKRKDSTIFQKKFQKTLIDKILNKEDKNLIIRWIESQIEAIKKVSLEEIGFPCKLARARKDYKNVPIFVRALENTENFDKLVGESFYYVYVIAKEYNTAVKQVEFLDNKILTPQMFKKEWYLNYGENVTAKQIKKDIARKEELLNNLETSGRLKIKETTLKGKPKDVIAFDSTHREHVKDLDWNRIIQRNIMMKLTSIFEAMKWDIEEVNYTPEILQNFLKTERKLNIQPLSEDQTQLF